MHSFLLAKICRFNRVIFFKYVFVLFKILYVKFFTNHFGPKMRKKHFIKDSPSCWQVFHFHVFVIYVKLEKTFIKIESLWEVNFKLYSNFVKFMLHNLKSDDNLCQLLNLKSFKYTYDQYTYFHILREYATGQHVGLF